MSESPLAPLHELYQVIHLPSLPSPAFAHSSLLRRTTPTPPTPSAAPSAVEWKLTLGFKSPHDQQQQRWYETQLDSHQIQTTFTVPGAAINALEMPDKVRKRWLEGGLDLTGWDHPEQPDGEDQVQLIIVITESLRLPIPLRRVAVPSLDLMDLAIRLTPGHNSSLLATSQLSTVSDQLANQEQQLTKVRHELKKAKETITELRKGGGAASGRGGGGGGGASSQAAAGTGGAVVRKADPLTPLPRPNSTPQAPPPLAKRRPPPMPKQARIITNDDENGGFEPVSDSD